MRAVLLWPVGEITAITATDIELGIRRNGISILNDVDQKSVANELGEAQAILCLSCIGVKNGISKNDHLKNNDRM